MNTFNEYYKALSTESEEEKRFSKMIDEENDRFENTIEYTEHYQRVRELREYLHDAFVKRMDCVKERRPKRSAIVDGSYKKAEKPKVEDSKELTDAISDVEKLSDHEKRMLWFRCMREDVPADESHKIDDETMNELHHILVQTVIDYINEKKLKNVEAISFSADGLLESADFGYWTPATDSFLTLEGITHEEWTDSDGVKRTFPARVEIGKSY